jgi:hypothetical protein
MRHIIAAGDAANIPAACPSISTEPEKTVAMPRGAYPTPNLPESQAMIDRSEVNRALAKAIAFKQCRKDDEAAHWATVLVTLLECAEILAPSSPAYTRISEATKRIYGYG